MATQKQIAANRAHAQKSTGPKTPEGKAIVARNATKHSLLARTITLDSESQERFDLLHQSYITSSTSPT
jgi:hypothetical protein